MDKNLLHSNQESAHVTPPPRFEPNEVAEAFGGPDERQYRDLIPGPRKLPVRIKFDEPIEFDGKSYTQVICDFGKLIGADFIRCERAFRATHKPANPNEVVLPEMSPEYHVILIARAGNVPEGLIRKLEERYYNPLRNEALKVCGSSAEEAKA